MPFSVIWMPVNGCMTLRLSSMPGGAMIVPGIPSSRPMPTSIFRNLKPCSMRCLEALAHLRAVGRGGRVAVAEHLVAELAARQLIGRDAIGLAGQIHQRHFDAADAAGLAGVVAELLDLAEDLVDVAGVLADQAALEQQRIGLAGAVAHLAVAGRGPGWCRCG